MTTNLNPLPGAAANFTVSNVENRNRNPGYNRRFHQWRKIRHCLEGQDEVQFQTTRYLPMPHGMDAIEYDNYLMRAQYFGIADRTLRGLTGLAFRVPPIFENMGPLEPWLDHATPEGHSLSQVSNEIFRDVITVGRFGVLVDMPEEDDLTFHDGEPIPMLSTYTAENIWDWGEITERGTRRLSRVLLEGAPQYHNLELRVTLFDCRLVDVSPEGSETPEWEYQIWKYLSITTKERHGLELVPPRFMTFAFDQGQLVFELKDVVIPKARGESLDMIPFVFFNPYDARTEPDKPPFLDLCDITLGLYRNSADYEHSLFLTAQPTPYMTGAKKEEKPQGIGAGAMWFSTSRDVTIGMLEFEGKGIQSIKEAMDDKKAEAAVLGASIIVDPEKENVSAETVRLQSRSSTSVMTSTIQAETAGLYKLIEYAGKWLGQEINAEIRLNTDFVETRMRPDEVTALVSAWQAQAFSHQTLHENLQRGEIVPYDRTLDEEMDLIEEEETELDAFEQKVRGVMGEFMLEQQGTEGGPPGEDPEQEEQAEAGRQGGGDPATGASQRPASRKKAAARREE